MTGWIENANLPRSRVVLAALSAEAELEREALEAMGVTCLPVPAYFGLQKPVASHGDMLLHHLGGNRMLFLDYDSRLSALLREAGAELLPLKAPPEPKYPKDVTLNFCRLGKFLIGNFQKGIPAPELVWECKKQALVPISVTQGYARCSIAVVDSSSVITADRGIAAALRQACIDVLEISPGHISLPGYDTGFLGGCCGKIGKDRMFFTGALSSHPDGAAIEAFLKEKSVTPVCIQNRPLTDIGGILPLLEIKEKEQ